MNLSKTSKYAFRILGHMAKDEKAMFSSQQLHKEIEVPEKPSNVCFGGKKRNILFITAREGIYTLEMKVKGVD